MLEGKEREREKSENETTVAERSILQHDLGNLETPVNGEGDGARCGNQSVFDGVDQESGGLSRHAELVDGAHLQAGAGTNGVMHRKASIGWVDDRLATEPAKLVSADAFPGIVAERIEKG